jgi:nuclear cap-binding protein subunit 2
MQNKNALPSSPYLSFRPFTNKTILSLIPSSSISISHIFTHSFLHFRYVGNLSFSTTENQIFTYFSQIAPVKNCIMGLDRVRKTPCGFCFIEYYTPEDAESASLYLSGTMLDDRAIRCALDHGYKADREFGRGSSGGQVRDERREGAADTARVVLSSTSTASASVGGKRSRDDDMDTKDESGEKGDQSNKRFARGSDKDED